MGKRIVMPMIRTQGDGPGTLIVLVIALVLLVLALALFGGDPQPTTGP